MSVIMTGLHLNVADFFGVVHIHNIGIMLLERVWEKLYWFVYCEFAMAQQVHAIVVNRSVTSSW